MKVEVQESEQVLIWNERFPKEKFPMESTVSC